MKNNSNHVNLDLRNEVLKIVDQLFKNLAFLDRESEKISLQIIESISAFYAEKNCGLHFIFEENVLPFLKRQPENIRLEKVKNLLTDGYIDIQDKRIHLRFLPFLNYKQPSGEEILTYVTEIL
ncbi:MAG: hypothetical protein NTZ27_05285 [Ignavibacteriales bacterium]|nr:hypothetical protein [Ignavibacteriales bacterium]